jgi:hypothetical protein
MKKGQKNFRLKAAKHPSLQFSNVGMSASAVDELVPASLQLQGRPVARLAAVVGALRLISRRLRCALLHASFLSVACQLLYIDIVSRSYRRRSLHRKLCKSQVSRRPIQAHT